MQLFASLFLNKIWESILFGSAFDFFFQIDFHFLHVFKQWARGVFLKTQNQMKVMESDGVILSNSSKAIILVCGFGFSLCRW